jgi:hypothetical protein
MIGHHRLGLAVAFGMLAATVLFRDAPTLAFAANRARSRSRPVVAPAFRPGHTQGPSNARDTIVVYVDFECPHCIAYGLELRDARASTQFAVTLRHRPLVRLHRNAFARCDCLRVRGRTRTLLPVR